jgi:hypothetical protein
MDTDCARFLVSLHLDSKKIGKLPQLPNGKYGPYHCLQSICFCSCPRRLQINVDIIIDVKNSQYRSAFTIQEP